MVRTAYEGRGVQAAHTLVLKIGKIPRDSLTRSQLAFVGGLLAVLVGLVMARRKWSEA